MTITTTTLRAFSAHCCGQDFTDRADWHAHRCTIPATPVGPYAGKARLVKRGKVAPVQRWDRGLGVRSAPAPLTEVEREWLGAYVSFSYGGREFVGQVWSLGQSFGTYSAITVAVMGDHGVNVLVTTDTVGARRLGGADWQAPLDLELAA